MNIKINLVQAFKFFGISGIGWIIDVLIYTILSSLLHLSVGFSNIISSFFAITFVFIFSTNKIFKNTKKISLKVKYLIYIIYQILLVTISSYILVVLKKYLNSFDNDFILSNINIICKIIITPFTMILNYLVMKYIIEKV